jgi:hypothetical protein
MAGTKYGRRYQRRLIEVNRDGSVSAFLIIHLAPYLADAMILAEATAGLNEAMAKIDDMLARTSPGQMPRPYLDHWTARRIADACDETLRPFLTRNVRRAEEEKI